ncbi:MAG: GGDEF domain-containing protein [Gammaproteobacteria bacterium]
MSLCLISGKLSKTRREQLVTNPPPANTSYYYYSVVLLLSGLVALYVAWDNIGPAADITVGSAIFVFVLSIFAIAVGYPHPSSGHVSFDRVGQVASLLVFGPLIATAISAAASFVYPVHRLAQGVSVKDVFIACLHNAGLMIWVVLGGGLFYTFAGGPVPIGTLTIVNLLKVMGAMLVMQIINEVGMSIYLLARSGTARNYFSLFNNGVEFAAGFIGVLVAATYLIGDPGLFSLLLAVLALGMFVLRRFAVMRNRLEVLVTERTSELEEKTRELEQKATHDKLTGLYNRRYVDDYLEAEIDAAVTGNKQFTIALADIDHFKLINDHHSHEIGDQVLVKVSELLSEHCRSTDTIARYGGEEFLLCFPRSTASDAEAVCEKLRRVIETHSWNTIGPNIRVTLSFGVAQIDERSTRKTILREADERLYSAKSLGRNKVVA